MQPCCLRSMISALTISFFQEQEGFEEADRKVDEWRAREIAKSIARSKVSTINFFRVRALKVLVCSECPC